MLVDVAFDRKLKQVIALDEIKLHAEELGEGFPLVAKGNRLSVFPVTAAQWKLLLSLEKNPDSLPESSPMSEAKRLAAEKPSSTLKTA